MQSSKKRPERLKILDTIGRSTSVDNKLTQAALLLEYLFERGVDFRRRIIKLTGEINEDMFDVLDVAMTELESESREDITIKINSSGGSTYQAMAIISRIKESRCKVVTKGYGNVMSAATLILASGTRRREMSEEGAFMWHEASYDPGELRHSQHEKLLDQVRKEEKFWAFKMSERSNPNEKFWLKKGVGVDAYFSAEELLELGVVDKLF